VKRIVDSEKQKNIVKRDSNKVPIEFCKPLPLIRGDVVRYALIMLRRFVREDYTLLAVRPHLMFGACCIDDLFPGSQTNCNAFNVFS